LIVVSFGSTVSRVLTPFFRSHRVLTEFNFTVIYHLLDDDLLIQQDFNQLSGYFIYGQCKKFFVSVVYLKSSAHRYILRGYPTHYVYNLSFPANKILILDLIYLFILLSLGLTGCL